MDPSKLMCPPTLSVVLVKTIKALCEINIKYDSKLEISGSLHVRSDGQKVLTCLLDEETTKGQHDAARIAELAARLSMAAATFPFTHLQMTPGNHSQQVAEALLSSMQGDVHLMNAAVAGIGVGIPMTGQQLIDGGLGGTHHKLPQTTANDSNYHQNAEEGNRQSMGTSLQPQEDTRQAVAAVLRQQQQCPDDQQQQQQQPSHHHHSGSRKQRQQQQQQQQDINKILASAAVQSNRMCNTSVVYTTSHSGGSASATRGSGYEEPGGHLENGPLSDGSASSAYGGAIIAGQNHIKLPDMQTLAHSLPKYPTATSGNSKTSRGSGASTSVHASSITSPGGASGTGKNDPQALSSQASYGAGDHGGAMPSPNCSPRLEDGNGLAGADDPVLAIDPMMSINIEVQSELDQDGVLIHRKRFQCMFCGIFLSTKCYLKNHVNAMHTRARVYPCELCERYFYSAGALRIHKLRNHWHGAKKHVCLQCGESFLLPIELRKHIVKKHYGRGVGAGGENGIAQPDSEQTHTLMEDVDMKLEDVEMPIMPTLRIIDAAGGLCSTSGRQKVRKRRGASHLSPPNLSSATTSQPLKLSSSFDQRPLS